MKLFGFIVLLLYVIVFSLKREKDICFCKEYSSALKGILSIMIVIHHFSLQTSLNIPFKGSLYSMGAVCVSIFFFLSGYGISMSTRQNVKNLLVYWRSRFVRLLLPFVTISFLCFFLSQMGVISVPYYSICEGRPFLPHSWFVLDLMFCYLIFVVYQAIRSLVFRYVWLFLSLFFNVGIAYVLDYPENWMGTTMSFGIGVVFSDLFDSIRTINWQKLSFIVLLSVLSIMFYDAGYADSPRSIWGILFISLIPICTISIWANFPLVIPIVAKKTMRFLGSISYEIYLMHGLFLYSIWIDTSSYRGLVYLLVFSVASSYMINRVNSFLASCLEKRLS